MIPGVERHGELHRRFPGFGLDSERVHASPKPGRMHFALRCSDRPGRRRKRSGTFPQCKRYGRMPAGPCLCCPRQTRQQYEDWLVVKKVSEIGIGRPALSTMLQVILEFYKFPLGDLSACCQCAKLLVIFGMR